MSPAKIFAALGEVIPAPETQDVAGSEFVVQIPVNVLQLFLGENVASRENEHVAFATGAARALMIFGA
jgi:hypothetical protein